MKSCRDCEKGSYCRSVVAGTSVEERAGLARRMQITCQHIKTLIGIQGRVEGLALALRIPPDLVGEILADDGALPNLKLASRLVESMRRLDQHDRAEDFRSRFDTAWFSKGKLNLQLAQSMIDNPKDYE